MNLFKSFLQEKLSAAKLFIIIAALFNFLFFNRGNFFLQQASPFLSVKAFHHEWQKNFSKKSLAPRVSAFLKRPAPLNVLSEEEHQEFPGARVVEALEINAPQSGQKMRLRVLETHFKYPYLRTEEVIDVASGALLQRNEMVATHFLVRLRAKEDPEHFLSQLGSDAIALERVTTKDSLYRLQLGSHSLATFSNIANEIKNKKISLLSAEPDFLVNALMLPNNPLYNQQWYLWQYCSNVEGTWDKRIFYSGIDASDAWDIRTSAESIVVAVIDTGIRYTHEDLAANMWHEEDPIYGTIYGWNFSVPQNDPEASDPMDHFGHGTACAGIIGGVGNSNVGVVGIAWKIKLMALKFLNDQGKGTVSDAVNCIDFASEHGAQILNCSWGYVLPREKALFDNVINVEDLTALEAAIDRARNQGVIIVAAAGNEGKNNDDDPEYPANYPFDNIVSVAASTEDNRLAWFSNYGATTVHLVAPGEEIFSTWGRNDHDYITVQNRKEVFDAIFGVNKSPDLQKQPEGTSLSAPQVVGTLALLKAQFPNWTYEQLIKRVINTCDQLPSLEKKVVGGKLNIARALSDPVN